jgi:hypothetical protein
LLLLQRDVKRRASLLIKVCMLMLVVRVVDVYWVVEPAFYGNRVRIYWTDLAAPLAVGGLWFALFFWQLGMRPLVPVNDRQLHGAPRETVAF